MIHKASEYKRPFLLLLQRGGMAILENVSLEGAELNGCQGRLQNPGNLFISSTMNT
jgi:hypothetical protein